MLARLLGAVIGKDDCYNRECVNIGLDILDKPQIFLKSWWANRTAALSHKQSWRLRQLTPLTLKNTGLIGLAETGLEFIPV